MELKRKCNSPLLVQQDAVGPEVTYRFAERSRLLNCACSSVQASLSRPTVEAEQSAGILAEQRDQRFLRRHPRKCPRGRGSESALRGFLSGAHREAESPTKSRCVPSLCRRDRAPMVNAPPPDQCRYDLALGQMPMAHQPGPGIFSQIFTRFAAEALVILEAH
jgi:hypothetical protein